MRVTAAAIGSVIELRKARSGRVHSVFTHAVNLQLGDELWTVVPRGGHDAALTVRLSDKVMPGDMGLRARDPVWVRCGHVRAGQAVIDARTAVRWIPRTYDADLRGLGERAAELEAAAALGSGHGSDLDDAVRQATGRGPGLTPAGDDVLVGVLAVLTSPVVAGGCGPVTARLRAALAAALPTTTEISRALLRQASHGHVSRPVWELTSGLLSGSSAAASARARADVLATGATSGGDTCAGLAAACRLLSRSPEWSNL
jgi:hypothetical protein